ncbi:putative groupII intron reverse transcriptase /maturase (mitochondrion) [Bryopsis sp. KO-2023]|nr:putative groupII intron reverse transcriptase /maturase [Bryopsis sp. KO-2023]
MHSSLTPGDRGKSKNSVGDRSVIGNLENTSDQYVPEKDKAHLMKMPDERTVDGNALPRNVAGQQLPLEREGNSERQTEVKANKDKSMLGIHYSNPGSVSYSDIYNLDNLKAGYAKLKAIVAPGIDGRTKTNITEKGLRKLSKQLKNQTYKPRPAKRIRIPTPDGGSRPFSMASTVDKIVQSTLKLLIEPYFEPQFRDISHGFRPGKSGHTALREIRGLWTNVTWLIKIDIQKYFDNTESRKRHHSILCEQMAPVLHTRSLQDLIHKLMKAGYVDVYSLTDHTQYDRLQGASIISPLCTNIFLHKLDCYIEHSLIPKYTHPRFSSKYKASLENTHLRWDEGGPVLALARGGANNKTPHRVASQPSPCRGPIQNAYETVKYLRYADSMLIGVIGSRKDATDIRMAVQEYMYKQLQLDINSHKSAIYHATTERTRFLGTDIIYSASPHFCEPKRITENRSEIFQSRASGASTQVDAINHPITRAQLYIPIRTLLKRATDRGYAKENAEKFARATANCRLSASEDRHIVNHFSAVIRGLVNYYSFANKRSSLWKVVSIYRKSCALTLAKKHNLRSAHAAFRKFGPNLRITERGKPVALLEYPDSLKTTSKFNIKSRSSNVTILEEPYKAQVFILGNKELSQLPVAPKERCELCASSQSLELYHLRSVQYIPKEGKEALEIAAIAKSRKQITLCRECHRYGVHKRTSRL